MSPASWATATAPATVTIAGLTVTAIGPGSDYNKVWIRIGPGTTKDKAGNPVGFRLRVDYWANAQDVPADEASIETGKLPTICGGLQRP